MGFQPFKVVFQLGTPLATRFRPLNLDGLLTYSIAIERFGYDHDEIVPIDLPLKRSGEKYPVWHASQMLIQGPLTRDFWVRQSSTEYATDSYETSTGGPNANRGSGAYKDRVEHFTRVDTPTVTFYGNGDVASVRDILALFKTTGLGSRRASGFGQVVGITVDPIEQDLSLFSADKVPARFLPEADWGTLAGRPQFSPASPPYWDKSRLVKGYEPWGNPFVMG